MQKQACNDNQLRDLLEQEYQIINYWCGRDLLHEVYNTQMPIIEQEFFALNFIFTALWEFINCQTDNETKQLQLALGDNIWQTVLTAKMTNNIQSMNRCWMYSANFIVLLHAYYIEYGCKSHLPNPDTQ